MLVIAKLMFKKVWCVVCGGATTGPIGPMMADGC